MTTVSEARPRHVDTSSRKSSLLMVGKIALIIFIVEVGIMLCLEHFKAFLHPLAEDFIDALTLMSVASPIIYFVAVRPFVIMAKDANERLEGQLERAERLLETNVKLQVSLKEATEALALSYDKILQKIGADLHDGPAQLLSYVLLMFDRAQALARKSGTEQDIETMAKLRGVLAEAMADVRAISMGLSLPELADLSVEDTVRLVLNRHRDISDVPVDVSFADVPVEASDTHKVCIYRFVQECLANVRKHSGASRASVVVSGQPDGCLVIKVLDTGSGFDPSAVHGGLGLTGMKARLHALGGTVSIRSAATSGTEVVANLPLVAKS